MADADALRDAGVSGVPATPQPVEPPAGLPGDDSVMSLVDHLGELRTRLFRIILAVVVGGAVGFMIADPIRDKLLDLIPDGTAQALGPGDGFAITLRISLVVGVILAMPVILYQVWAFIAPGLTPAERKAIRPWVPLALFFFALGVVIAYLVLPYALSFLFSFTDDRLIENVAAGPFFDFITTTFLAFGLVMEFPILLYGLTRVGILHSDQLRAARRYVILGIAIFSAVATPGGDLVSPFVLGGTMYLLYELTVWFIRRTGR
ncbi:MAG TPA: twin-arginine translocase subunit TatC [Candidatus Saccharimonadales bacterium]|nr:twin-arginine translocase subunit TatC [Candidatus Saccharimonadales bacterium]